MSASIQPDAARRLLPLVPALCMSFYWLASFGTGESFGASATYRYGDYNYFPLIAGLSHFDFGEWSVLEHVGEGVPPFPVPSLAVHALGLALFGAPGFVLADLLIVVGTYFAARRFLLSAALSRTTAEALALVVSCGFLGLEDVHLRRWLVQIGLKLWGFRLPRPFVTDLFLLLSVGSLLRIFVGRKQAAKEWIGLGIGFGLLLQSRYYSAVTVGLAIAAAAAVAFIRGPERRRLLTGAMTTGATTLLVALPFLVQLRLGNPEVRARLGAFPVDRLRPLVLEGRLMEVLVPALFAVLVATVVRAAHLPRNRERDRALLALAGLFVLAGVALPASTIVLGESIQPYQFVGEIATFKTLALLVALAHLLELAALRAGRALPRLSRAPGVRAALLAGVAVLCLALAPSLHRPALQQSGHIRDDFPSYRIPGYRKAFRELTTELGRVAGPDLRVLASLDIQVLDWWSLFGGGHTFAPNACATNISDDEIEDRLLRLCRILGATRDDVARLLSDRAVLIYLLGCAKYQASSAYRFAPLVDYPLPLRRTILESSSLDSWQMVLPSSERDRLLKRYDETRSDAEDPRLDVIVLGRRSLDGNYVPAADRFRLTFENEVFRVYRPGSG